MGSKKLALLILDGWGYGKDTSSNAVARANTPFFDQLIASYPHTTLEASGEAVGLPAGQMGNSEVGHMNLGAGRVVYQELGRINKEVRDGGLITNPVIAGAFDYAKKENKQVHFIGLLSDGGVHSHITHLMGLCDAANAKQLDRVFIHAFLDGRDTDPVSGLGFIRQLKAHIRQSPVKIASLIGRYFAMDRDHRWERVKLAYDLLVKGTGTRSTNLAAALAQSYEQGVTDEFVQPVVATDGTGEPLATIRPGDVVICFNFRTDRGREITMALTQQALPEFDMRPLPLYYVTMTSYDDTFREVRVVFTREDLTETIGEVLEKYNKTQVRIAETEKYPHVTFFFSGGREKEFRGEKRIMIPSPKVATYDLQAEMSAGGIKDAIIKEFAENAPDFVCLNFANPDMVGHTGVFNAVVKAVETVDRCTKEVVEKGRELGYSFIVIADHGNAEYMLNDDGTPNTAHTTNLVPCILIDNDYHAIRPGKLGDIAPTILTLLGVPVPAGMNGEVLI